MELFERSKLLPRRRARKGRVPAKSRHSICIDAGAACSVGGVTFAELKLTELKLEDSMTLFLVIASGLVAAIALALAALAALRWLDRRELRAVAASLRKSPESPITFSEELLAELPSAARRYFLHSIAPGTPLAGTVELEMIGHFRTGPDRPWQNMRAAEILAPGRGFTWQARIGDGAWLEGSDRYEGGAGRMRVWLWGLVPLVNAAGFDIAKSDVGRLAAESIWLPAGLLRQQGIRWEEVGEDAALALFAIDGVPVELTLFVDPSGRLLELRLPRWGNLTAEGEHDYVPFGVSMTAERTIDGYTIPTEVTAGWWPDTERYFEFFRATIERARFS